MEEKSDRILLLGAKQGDVDAQHTLVKRHWQWLFTIAFKVVRDQLDAEDIAEEVFQELWNEGQLVGDNFRPWLRTVTYRRSIDKLRRKKIRRWSQLPDVPAKPESPIVRDIECPRLLEVLSRLKEIERLIILQVADNCSLKEIAETLDISLAATKSHLSRARQKCVAFFDQKRPRLINNEVQD